MALDFNEWLEAGIKAGFCGPGVCYTHDGLPTSEEEDAEFEDGDPCIHIIRLYDAPDTKAGVEENHAPSIWRATNLGIEL